MSLKSRIDRLEAKAQTQKDIWENQITTIEIYCTSPEGDRELLEVWTAKPAGGWDYKDCRNEHK